VERVGERMSVFVFVCVCVCEEWIRKKAAEKEEKGEGEVGKHTLARCRPSWIFLDISHLSFPGEAILARAHLCARAHVDVTVRVPEPCRREREGKGAAAKERGIQRERERGRGRKRERREEGKCRSRNEDASCFPSSTQQHAPLSHHP
jgi:hypothetical protein